MARNSTSLLFAFAVFLILCNSTRQELRPVCKCEKLKSNCSCRSLSSSTLRHRLMCEETGILPHKDQVLMLDLSMNRIVNISKRSFSCFSRLLTLSLSHNKIEVLLYEAFSGLNSLTTLNLSNNPLVRFHGNLSGILPELSIIDATGIRHWQIERKLQQLGQLRRISGQPFIEKYCINCWISRSRNTTLIPKIYQIKASCHTYKFPPDSNSSFVQFLNATSFQFRCVSDDETKRCFERFYNFGLGMATNLCWEAILTANNCKFAIGLITVVLNTVVFCLIVTSKRLRQNVSLCLVGNMALSDLIMGVYIITISIYLNSYSFQYIYNMGNKNCKKIGFLWVLGQAGSVQTTFFLTLERYFVIVHCLNPDLRLSRRMAMCLIAFSWCLAAILVYWASDYNFYTNTFLCIPISITKANLTAAAFYSFFIASLALLFFFLSFLLYIRIYFAAKATAQSAGVQRESKLAKRIALLVFSNMFFFFFPVLCMGIVSLAMTDSIEEYNANAFRSIMINVFPSLCVSVNSCCNPVLHAFRQDQFKTVLKQRVAVVRNSACFVPFARLSKCCRVASGRITVLYERIRIRFNQTGNNVHSSPDTNTT